MTTDITELAQSLKAAANTTADAIDRLKAFPGDELIDLSQHEGEQVDIDITTLNEWYELSSPANILALVEALEKAQGMEAYWKTQCRGITDHCEELQARIAELESRTVKLPQRLQPGADGYDDWYVHSDDDGEYLKVDDVLAMLTAAGIKVEAE